MTKTELRQAAQRARRYGHYVNGQKLSLDCPKCRTRIETERNYGYRPAGKGKPYSAEVDGVRCVFRQETVSEALDRAVIDHLTYDCQATS